MKQAPINIIRCILKQEECMTPSMIRRFIDRPMRNNCLDDLIESGEIIATTTPTGGQIFRLPSSRKTP